MKRFARALAVTLGLAVIGSVVSLVPQKNAAADGGAPVNIISPLPLPVTGNVNAAVSGTVGVSNFPGVQPVSLTNTSSAPLVTRDADNPGHDRFFHSFGCQTLPGQPLCDDVFKVPSGMELVIETVTVSPRLPAGERPAVELDFTYAVAGGFALYSAWFPLTFEGTFASVIPPDSYVVTQPVRVYVDGGQLITFHGLESAEAGGALFNATVTGYSVSCGAGPGCPLP